MFKVLLWEIKVLGQDFFFLTHLGYYNLGTAFPVVSLPQNDFVPIHTPSYLCWQYGLDTFWKFFVYIAVHRITGYVCNRLNREKKIVLKKIIASEIAVSLKQTENPTFAWALNKIVASQLPGMQWWCCSGAHLPYPLAEASQLLGTHPTEAQGWPKAQWESKLLKWGCWALDATPFSPKSVGKFPLISKSESFTTGQCYPTKKVPVIIWLFRQHEGDFCLHSSSVCVQLCSICVPHCPQHGWGGWDYSQVSLVIFRDSAELSKELNWLSENGDYSKPVPKGTLSLCHSCLVRKSKVCTVSGSGKGMVALILYHQNSYLNFSFTSLYWMQHLSPFSRLSFPSWEINVEKVKMVQEYAFYFKIGIFFFFFFSMLIDSQPACKFDPMPIKIS